MRRARTSLLCGMIFAGLVGACGREADPAPEGEGPTRIEAEAPAPVFACPGEAALIVAACADETLAPQVEQLAQALGDAREALSPDGRRLLNEGARAWAEAQAVSCGLQGGEAPDEEARRCLADAFKARLEAAAAEVAERGGFTFQRVALVEAEPVAEAAAAAAGLGDFAPEAVVRDVAFPRIDNPERRPAIERFNAVMAQRPIESPPDAPTEQQVVYSIAYASDELVSVRFDTYDYTLGAAHPNTSMRGVTVLMATGEEIAPGDVFAARSGWERFLTERALEGLEEAFAEAGPPEAADVRDTATKTHNWVISEKGLTLLFPPYSVGPHALGPQEVTISWADLKPYLNPAAPAPIGSG